MIEYYFFLHSDNTIEEAVTVSQRSAKTAMSNRMRHMLHRWHHLLACAIQGHDAVHVNGEATR